MKKDFFKKALSLALSVALLVPTGGIFVSAAPTDLETDITNVVLDVVLPTAANAGKVAINPLEFKDAGSQITTNNWSFYNKTKIPVKVTAEISATIPADGVTLAKAKSEVNDYQNDGGDPTNKDKQIYIEAVPASAMVVDSTNLAAISTTSATYAGSDVAVIGASDSPNKATIEFYLDKAVVDVDDVTTALAANDAGVAAMRLKGLVNPYAPAYVATDLKVSILWEASGLKGSMYTAATTGANTLKALNVYSIKGATPANAGPSITQTGNLSVSKGGTLTLNYALGSGTLAATADPTYTNLKYDYLTFLGQSFTAAHATVNTASKTITITAAFTNAFNVGDTVSLIINFPGGQTVRRTLNITA